MIKAETLPDAMWAIETEKKLLNQIRISAVESSDESIQIWKVIAGIMLRPWSLNPLFSFVLIAVFVLMAAGGVAVRESVPGDQFYSAKINIEKARMVFALSKDQKARIRLDSMEKRVNELRKISVNKKEDSNKEGRVKELVAVVKKDMGPFEQDAPHLKISTVVNIRKKAEEYIDTLDIVVSDLTKDFSKSEGESLNKEVDEIQDLLDSTNKTLLVRIASALENEEKGVEDVITKSEAEKLIASALNDVIEEAQKLDSGQGEPNEEPSKQGTDEQGNATEDGMETEENEEVAGQAEGQSATKDLLDKAQDSLDKKNLVDTINSIIEAKDLIDTINAEVSSAEEGGEITQTGEVESAEDESNGAKAKETEDISQPEEVAVDGQSASKQEVEKQVNNDNEETQENN